MFKLQKNKASEILNDIFELKALLTMKSRTIRKIMAFRINIMEYYETYLAFTGAGIVSKIKKWGLVSAKTKRLYLLKKLLIKNQELDLASLSLHLKHLYLEHLTSRVRFLAPSMRQPLCRYLYQHLQIFFI